MDDRLPDALDVLRNAILADPATAERLAVIEHVEGFKAEAAALAASLGLTIDDQALADALRPDPLGLDRFSDAPARGDDWPVGNWLPASVARGGGELVVDWSHFGEVTLDVPFFEEALRRSRRRWLNRLMRHRTRLATLAERAHMPLAVPDGLIFHASRSGSTLVTRMLGAIAGTVALSEPPPIDDVVQLPHTDPGIRFDEHVASLRAMVAALGRSAAGGQRRYFVKLDSWHVRALPLFRAAFPSTPWVFVYRDPVEVLVSHMRSRGLQTVPGALPATIFDISGDDRMSGEEYCARILARIFDAALDNSQLGGGLYVNYAELPHALETAIVPHFGVVLTTRDRDALAAVAARDAKAPHHSFVVDRDDKQRGASDAILAAAARFAAEPYRRLESLRMSAL